jgi:hypothetical protein
MVNDSLAIPAKDGELLQPIVAEEQGVDSTLQAGIDSIRSLFNGRNYRTIKKQRLAINANQGKPPRSHEAKMLHGR